MVENVIAPITGRCKNGFERDDRNEGRYNCKFFGIFVIPSPPPLPWILIFDVYFCNRKPLQPNKNMTKRKQK